MTDQQDPQPEPAPVFPTQEGGAVPAEHVMPAEEFFSGTMWHYLMVLDVTGIPDILCEPLLRYLTRASFEFLGSGKFSVWNNNNSIAIACHTVPGKMDLFEERVTEATRIFATNHLVRINRYVMNLQRSIK